MEILLNSDSAKQAAPKLLELIAATSALSGRTVSCSNCNALAAENAAMREAIKEARASLDDCREDTCELIAERDWWKNEPRCGYSARWAEMQARLAKAESTLSKLQPYLK